MKINLIKLLRFSTENILIILCSIFFAGIVCLLLYLFLEKSNFLKIGLIFLGSSLFIIPSLFLYKKLRFLETIEIIQNCKFEVLSISEITIDYFEISRLKHDGTKETPLDITYKKYYWKNFKKVDLDKDRHTLNFISRKGENLIITSKYNGWYKLIAHIPKDYFPTFDYSFVNIIYAQFIGCKICGAIATLQDQCKNCYNKIWSENLLLEYKNELEYIKEEQLDWFSTCEKDEPIDFSLDHFERDQNWELLVSKKDIINYSSEYNWDE